MHPPGAAWVWDDFAFTQGASDLIGVLFLAIGVITFALRPYEPPSWALLSLSLAGERHVAHDVRAARRRAPLGSAVLPHPRRIRRLRAGAHGARVSGRASAAGAASAHPVADLRHRRPAGGRQSRGAGTRTTPAVFAYTRTIGSAAMLIGIAAIIGRCAELAMHTRDPLVAQRARILLAGAVLGIAPIAHRRSSCARASARSRSTTASCSGRSASSSSPLARVTVRRRCSTRASRCAGPCSTPPPSRSSRRPRMLLISVRPVRGGRAALSAALPLAALRRAPATVASIRSGRAFPSCCASTATSSAPPAASTAVLDVLAAAPARLCDARSSVAFLLAGGIGGIETVRGAGGVPRRRRAGRSPTSCSCS